MYSRILFMLIVTSIFFCSCSTKKEIEPALVHGEGTKQRHKSASNSPVQEGIDAIKGEQLTGYTASTIGAAFGAYRHFQKSEWKETKTASGKAYVDFTGWFKTATVDIGAIKKGAGVKGVEIKFVIYPDAVFDISMISRVEVGSDGKATATPIKEQKYVLDSIYANKELAL